MLYSFFFYLFDLHIYNEFTLLYLGLSYIFFFFLHVLKEFIKFICHFLFFLWSKFLFQCIFSSDFSISPYWCWYSWWLLLSIPFLFICRHNWIFSCLLIIWNLMNRSFWVTIFFKWLLIKCFKSLLHILSSSKYPLWDCWILLLFIIWFELIISTDWCWWWFLFLSLHFFLWCIILSNLLLGFWEFIILIFTSSIYTYRFHGRLWAFD